LSKKEQSVSVTELPLLHWIPHWELPEKTQLVTTREMEEEDAHIPSPKLSETKQSVRVASELSWKLIPAPPLTAELPAMVQLTNAADEFTTQHTPPPFREAELPVMMQFLTVGEELSTQYIPPPSRSSEGRKLSATPPVIVNPSMRVVLVTNRQ
jgi:hypothetical protein